MYRMKLYKQLEKEFSPETAKRLLTFMDKGGDEPGLHLELEKKLSPGKAKKLLSFFDNISLETVQEILKFLNSKVKS